MKTARLHKLTRRFELWLAIVCILYGVLVAGTALLLNHSDLLRLDQHSVGRIWLPGSYAPEAGYDVSISTVLRDLHGGLLFSRVAARLLDAIALLWLVAFGLELTIGIHNSRKPHLAFEAAVKRPPAQPIRQPLPKAAPYGEMGPRPTRGKVLEFKRPS